MVFHSCVAVFLSWDFLLFFFLFFFSIPLSPLTLITCWLFSPLVEPSGHECDMRFRSLHSRFCSDFCSWKVLSNWFKLSRYLNYRLNVIVSPFDDKLAWPPYPLFSLWSNEAYKSGFAVGLFGNKSRQCGAGLQSRIDPIKACVWSPMWTLSRSLGGSFQKQGHTPNMGSEWKNPPALMGKQQTPCLLEPLLRVKCFSYLVNSC